VSEAELIAHGTKPVVRVGLLLLLRHGAACAVLGQLLLGGY
jgi:hypothetical protein